jgi:hypothetical protein
MGERRSRQGRDHHRAATGTTRRDVRRVHAHEDSQDPGGPIGAEAAAALRTHRKQQRELMMANRKVYQDFDLVFAKQPENQQTPKAKLGEPCFALADSHFRRVIKAAGVKTIGVQGMRHTCDVAARGRGAGKGAGRCRSTRCGAVGPLTGC